METVLQSIQTLYAIQPATNAASIPSAYTTTITALLPPNPLSPSLGAQPQATSSFTTITITVPVDPQTLTAIPPPPYLANPTAPQDQQQQPQPQLQPPDDESKPALQPYQIFLIVFFGLASIPVSMAFFWCIGSMRRRNFRYSQGEEWSSSWWKRRALLLRGRRKPPTKMEKVQASARRFSAAVGNWVGLDFGAGVGAQEGNGDAEYQDGEGGTGDEGVVVESEVGRAWARPRTREDDEDLVVTIPRPVAEGEGGKRRDKRWSNFRVKMDDGKQETQKQQDEDTGYG